MAYKVYVGNYPMYFTEDDVLQIFQDFEGIELVGFFKNKNKCYSFLHCMNERQLLEVILNLHDIDVSGRNLIVRAAEENLHNKIQKSMLEKGVMGVNVHPKNTCDINNPTSGSRNKETFQRSEARHFKQSEIPRAGKLLAKNTSDINYSISGSGNIGTYESSEARHFKQLEIQQAGTSDIKNAYPKKHYMGNNASHSAIPNSYNNANRDSGKNYGLSNKYENHDYSTHSYESNYSPEPNSHSNPTYSNGTKGRCYNPNVYESEGDRSGICINPQDTFSKSSASTHYKTMNERFDSYKTKSMHNNEDPTSIGQHPNYSTRGQNQSRYRNASESSLETVHDMPSSQEHKKLSFVSVMNFPLRMPVKDLYKLFSDFNPIKVFVICNEPGMDRTPTEAIIGFENDKNATEAILTLDNTVYQGRVLLVTDSVDMSIVSELLSFG